MTSQITRIHTSTILNFYCKICAHDGKPKSFSSLDALDSHHKVAHIPNLELQNTLRVAEIRESIKSLRGLNAGKTLFDGEPSSNALEPNGFSVESPLDLSASTHDHLNFDDASPCVSLEPVKRDTYPGVIPEPILVDLTDDTPIVPILEVAGSSGPQKIFQYYDCPACKASFQTQGFLDLHVEEPHAKPRVKTNVRPRLRVDATACKPCGVKFHAYKEYKAHRSTIEHQTTMKAQTARQMDNLDI